MLLLQPVSLRNSGGWLKLHPSDPFHALLCSQGFLQTPVPFVLCNASPRLWVACAQRVLLHRVPKSDFRLLSLLRPSTCFTSTFCELTFLLLLFILPLNLSYTPCAQLRCTNCLRYPVVACEILSAEVDEIETVLITPEVLSVVFGFFNQEKVNVLLANLVIRVLGSLMITRLETVRFFILCSMRP